MTTNSRYPTDFAKQYQQQQILNASAAQQIVLLYEGAIGFTNRARESINAGNIQERYNNNRRAMEIVNYLMEILDEQRGGQVAQRLRRIYGFILRRQLEVNFKNDPRICDEIVGHLRTLKGTWEAIARQDDQQRNQATVPATQVVPGTSNQDVPGSLPRPNSAVA